MLKIFNWLIASTLLTAFFACRNDVGNKSIVNTNSTELTESETISAPEGMVWIPAKTFIQGGKDNDNFALPREKPGHKVYVDGFFIDKHEVTNGQFQKFVDSTGYITVAERPIDWEVMKLDLPEGTQRPPDSLLQPGSLIFNRDVKEVASMGNYFQWWTWKLGANWKHPGGPDTDIIGKENFPVVHIAYEDAVAYCEWANRRLPTEAQWESAAQASNTDNIFTWGNDIDVLNDNANTWQGVFPIKNEPEDGYAFVAKVESFPPNEYGIYDMLGNVWELTSDWFNEHYYESLDTSETINNPVGASESYSSSNPYQKEKIIKGGSFLCNASYCASFRISARMGMAIDSGSDHVGFRTVALPDMLNEKQD